MPKRYKTEDPGIVKGIKLVGVGKRGSEPLANEIIDEIIADIESKRPGPAALGAFFAGLVNKGMTADEERLDQVFDEPTLKDPVKLVNALGGDSPHWVRALVVDLLEGQTLDVDNAHQLGEYLFSPEAYDGIKGMVASFLRVRYETADEYEGLLKAMEETMASSFQEGPPQGDPILQFADPFDGVDHSMIIAPLVSRFFQQQNFRVINMVGRNSGPKLVFNAYDIATKLNALMAKSNADLGLPKPEYGWYYHQAELSSTIDAWVETRRETIKRPFLATLEKFLNPAKADIIVTSAFHPPYGEKMLTISERAGFPGAIVVRNGIEGSIAFPLMRKAKILCSARQADGSYRRHEFDFDAQEILKIEIEKEERLDEPDINENVALIKQYVDDGLTGNHLFNWRVQATCRGLRRAIDWVVSNR